MTTEKQPGTPLPWHVTVNGEEVELHDGASAHGFDLYVYNLTDGVALSEQDARYIVHACNAYPDLHKQRDDLLAALEQIEAEMAFPNQLEAGFVHGKPSLKDMAQRVELARSIARTAISRARGEEG